MGNKKFHNYETFFRDKKFYQRIIEIIMDAQKQYNYFDLSYRTGSDVWTHTPYHKTALRILPSLPAGTIVLDIGSGRGIWAVKLIEQGYRVIGVDYVKSIVDKLNQDIKEYANAEKIRFIQAEATDLPFIDNSIELATEIGLMQHFDHDHQLKYVAELQRIIKPGGYVLSVNLSDQTPRYLDFTPKTKNNSPYEKFGVSYTFFSKEEVAEMFGQYGFTTIHQEIEFFDSRTDPGESLGLLFTLAQKK